MPPAVLNGFYNILLRQNQLYRNYTITVTNDPLPRDIDTEVSNKCSYLIYLWVVVYVGEKCYVCVCVYVIRYIY